MAEFKFSSHHGTSKLEAYHRPLVPSRSERAADNPKKNATGGGASAPTADKGVSGSSNTGDSDLPVRGPAAAQSMTGRGQGDHAPEPEAID